MPEELHSSMDSYSPCSSNTWSVPGSGRCFLHFVFTVVNFLPAQRLQQKSVGFWKVLFLKIKMRRDQSKKLKIFELKNRRIDPSIKLFRTNALLMSLTDSVCLLQQKSKPLQLNLKSASYHVFPTEYVIFTSSKITRSTCFPSTKIATIVCICRNTENLQIDCISSNSAHLGPRHLALFLARENVNEFGL